MTVAQIPHLKTAFDPPVLLPTQILYEDAETGLRARTLLEKVQAELQEETQFIQSWFRFDLVENSSSKSAQMEDATIIVLSAHGRAGLPEAVQKRVEALLNAKTGTGPALVILLDCKANASTSTTHALNRLKLAVAQAGGGLFTHFDEQAGERNRDFLMRSPETLSHRHWGLNE